MLGSFYFGGIKNRYPLTVASSQILVSMVDIFNGALLYFEKSLKFKGEIHPSYRGRIPHRASGLGVHRADSTRVRFKLDSDIFKLDHAENFFAGESIIHRIEFIAVMRDGGRKCLVAILP